MDANLMFTFCSLAVAFFNAVSLSYIWRALRFLRSYFPAGPQKRSDRDAARSITDLAHCEPVKERASAAKKRV
ncbi:hypothetical protein FHW16_003823 [Phyllobacterium myrsinacearum]|uniref:Uncharacterized protein n=1 Tax=Phyllobacterium myrsinacearum TaxID=28101 RepID=A0A839ERG4_9HYPH|nr:hypothetical protein [Phyllobacterium myrsinacearum]